MSKLSGEYLIEILKPSRACIHTLWWALSPEEQRSIREHLRLMTSKDIDGLEAEKKLRLFELLEFITREKPTDSSAN